MSRPETSAGPTDVVLTSLTSVERRLITLDILRAVAAGAALATLALLVLRAGGVSARFGAAFSALAGLCTTLTMTLGRSRGWTRAEAAKAAERARPESRNVVVTAEELLRRPGAGRAAIRDRVFRDAATAIRLVAPAQAIPLRGAAMLCAAALVTLAGTWTVQSTRSGSTVRQAAADLARTLAGPSPGVARVTATITPPGYLGSPVLRLEDPERIEAVAGSQLALQISGRQLREIRLGSTILEATPTDEGVSVAAELSDSTYLAIEGESGGSDARRLIPVIVTPDRAPTILLGRPGKDLLLPDSRATVPVSATALDDFGMKSLELRYTRVSGSGEQFSFEEGVLPLQLERESERSWKGRTSLVLAALKLGPGDSVVYRVVGADGRPGRAGMASSDTFFVEIAGPDQVTVAGFELPPERERYALSQQMIVLKIERLRGRERSIGREALSEEAASIAAEQRAVRANFIFLTGGHVEDEEQEAEHSHEIQEGRLAHSARKEMSAAIQYMSHAEQALIAVDTGAALPPAKAAVDALQRAFGRNRYFMRTLPTRSRLDPSRRLAGDLDEVEDSRRTPETAVASPRVLAARRLLVEFLELAPSLEAQPKSVDRTRIASMAERALAVDAASPTWQQVAASLLRMRDAIASGAAVETEADVRQVMDGLQSEAQRGAVPPVPRHDRDPALRSAWSERSGGR